MSISIACVSCGKVYKLDDRFAGKRVKCNRCGSTFSVPAEAPVPEEGDAQAQPAAQPAVAAVASTPAESAHAEPPPPAPTPSVDAGDSGAAEGDESSEFSSSPSGDIAGDAAGGSSDDWSDGAAADAPATAMAGHQDQETGNTMAAGTPVAEPAPSAPKVSERQGRERTVRVSPADRPGFVPANYPSPKPVAPARRSLCGLVAGVLYVLGIGVEALGWYQMAAFELHERSGGFANERLLRIELRGGIDVIAGLLILIFAALIHLRATPKQAQAVSE